MARTGLAIAVIAVSVLLHLGVLGVIVMAERRHLTQPETEMVEVELVQPEIPQEPPKPEPPKPELPKPEPPKPELSKQKLPEPGAPKQSAPKQSAPKPEASKPEPPAEPPVAKPERPSDEPPPVAEKPQMPSGGPPSETKAKLTAAEIAAFRAEIQKCWELPVGMPDMMKLEVVLRVALTRKGTLAASPDLLKAPASLSGPRLVGIAMQALAACAPYKSLPVSKYDEWKVLDLRFLATGPAGLDSSRPPPGRRSKG